MAEVWLSPGSWTHEQWMAFAILAFVLLGVLLVALKLVRILRDAVKPPKRELPNLRPGRRPGPKR